MAAPAAAGAPAPYNEFADLDRAKELIDQVKPPGVTGPVPNMGPANRTYTNAIDAIRNYILELQENPQDAEKPRTDVPEINDALTLIENAQKEMIRYAEDIILDENAFQERMQTFVDKMENLHLPLDKKVMRARFVSIRQDEILSRAGSGNSNAGNNSNNETIGNTNARSVGGRRRRKRSTRKFRKTKRKSRKTRRR